jgi:hypothetical protein
MLKSLLSSDTLSWVVNENLFQKIQKISAEFGVVRDDFLSYMSASARQIENLARTYV